MSDQGRAENPQQDEDTDVPDLDVTESSGDAVKGGIPKSDNGDC